MQIQIFFAARRATNKWLGYKFCASLSGEALLYIGDNPCVIVLKWMDIFGWFPYHLKQKNTREYMKGRKRDIKNMTVCDLLANAKLLYKQKTENDLSAGYVKAVLAYKASEKLAEIL